jgi:CHAD domain-containing protein
MKPLERLIDDLVEVMRRTADKVDADAVHDLRVSVRRTTEALRLAKDFDRARRLAKEIKALRDCAASVRDRDVIRELLRKHRLPAADPACIYLQGQRDLAAEQLQKFLRKLLRKERPQRWKRWMEEAS